MRIILMKVLKKARKHPKTVETKVSGSPSPFSNMFYVFHCGRQNIHACYECSVGPQFRKRWECFHQKPQSCRLAISYTELLRYRHDLAAFSYKIRKNAFKCHHISRTISSPLGQLIFGTMREKSLQCMI